MGSKKRNQEKKNKNGETGGADSACGNRTLVQEMGGKVISDPRFAFVHSDPRFQKFRKKETKVAVDARFRPVFTDNHYASSSAPVDKRGKRRKGKDPKDLLRHYYQLEEEDVTEEKQEGLEWVKRGLVTEDEGDSENETESEESLQSGGKLTRFGEVSNEEEEERKEVEENEEEEEEDKGSEEESTTDEEEDTEEEIYEDGRPELPEESIPEIEQETRRLAVVNMDWRHVSATDLYVVLSSFLPKNGQISYVAVYPSEFGLQRMKEEEFRGPIGLFDDGNEEDDDDIGEDEDIINQKLRAYEISRLRYYFGVVECDSSATAAYLYKVCDGVEFERSSNKLDLRFIPDSMEFKHSPRDMATEAPANYTGVDFHNQALQLSNVKLTWDEDEPHRVKTLKRKFKAERLAELELKEFLASDESASEDEMNDELDMDGKKKEARESRYRALIESGDDASDEDEREGDQDMEVTFNTGLEDLSKRILEKKDKKLETVWEAYLRRRKEKKKARKNKSQQSLDDEDSSGISDQEAREQPDDFFVEDLPAKREKEMKKNKDMEKQEEASRAELELLVAGDDDDNTGIKGYNLKRKKLRERERDDEKLLAAELDSDPRFSVVFSSSQYALDPTDAQFKRSATYARQLAQKLRKGEREHKMDDRMDLPMNPNITEGKEGGSLKSEDLSGSKKQKYELSSLVRSIKMRSQQLIPSRKESDKGGKRKRMKVRENKVNSDLSSLVESIKRKTETASK